MNDDYIFGFILGSIIGIVITCVLCIAYNQRIITAEDYYKCKKLNIQVKTYNEYIDKEIKCLDIIKIVEINNE